MGIWPDFAHLARYQTYGSGPEDVAQAKPGRLKENTVSISTATRKELDRAFIRELKKRQSKIRKRRERKEKIEEKRDA